MTTAWNQDKGFILETRIPGTLAWMCVALPQPSILRTPPMGLRKEPTIALQGEAWIGIKRRDRRDQYGIRGMKERMAADREVDGWEGDGRSTIDQRV
jgi:hypothetical protein